jgi:hypothetical protein
MIALSNLSEPEKGDDFPLQAYQALGDPEG